MYLAGGIFGSLCSLWQHVLTKRFQYYTYGASGAVWALMTAWAYFAIEFVSPIQTPPTCSPIHLVSNEKLTNLISKPSPSTETSAYAIRVVQWTLLGVQFFSHLTPGVTHKMDVASHAGGAAVGLLGAWALKRHNARRDGAAEAEKTEKVVVAPLSR